MYENLRKLAGSRWREPNNLSKLLSSEDDAYRAPRHEILQAAKRKLGLNAPITEVTPRQTLETLVARLGKKWQPLHKYEQLLEKHMQYRQPKYLFRGVRGAGNQGVSQVLNPYLGGYNSKWVHGTPHLRSAALYGTPSTEVDIARALPGIVHKYKSYPKQVYGKDYKLESIARSMRKGELSAAKRLRKGMSVANLTARMPDWQPGYWPQITQQAVTRGRSGFGVIDSLVNRVLPRSRALARPHSRSLLETLAYETPIRPRRNPFVSSLLVDAGGDKFMRLSPAQAKAVAYFYRNAFEPTQIMPDVTRNPVTNTIEFKAAPIATKGKVTAQSNAITTKPSVSTLQKAPTPPKRIFTPKRIAGAGAATAGLALLPEAIRAVRRLVAN